jgi:uncharacterized membrane protein
MTLLLAFLIGLFAGLRSLTAPATTGWATHLGWLKLERPLSLIGSVPAVVILNVLAVAELVADKLPKTSNRTFPQGLIARIVMGGPTCWRRAQRSSGCGRCLASRRASR